MGSSSQRRRFRLGVGGRTTTRYKLAAAFLETRLGAAGEDPGSDLAASRLSNPIDAGRTQPASPLLSRLP